MTSQAGTDPTRIKVLFVNGSVERAGAERIFYHLVRHIDRRRFDPHVAFMGKGPFRDEVAELGVPIIDIEPCARVRELWRWPSTIDSIVGAIDEVKPDVLHSNGERVSIFSGRAAKRRNIPSVAWLQDSPGGAGLTSWLAQIALAKTPISQIITCARWMEEGFNARLGFDAKTILSCIDIDSLPTGSVALDTLKEDAGWARDDLVIGHFARFQRWKGTDVFLKAAAHVSKSFDETRFVVVGDAMFGREEGYGEELRSLASSLGLDDRIVFTGYRSDALQIMAGCDVVAHCSVKPDPFPTVVMEGMAMGRAVIATYSKGPEEAIQDGTTGILVTPGSDQELADAMKRVIADPHLRRSMGEAARIHAKQHLDAPRMAASFEDLYTRLVGRAT